MEAPMHDMSSLFAQLGLATDEASIRQFILSHGPLPHGVLLAEAPFWSASQASFLNEKILEDADWAEVIDELNTRLHATND